MGFVRLKSGYVFVAYGSETALAGSIQRTVNVASSLDTADIQAGTYVADLTINQAITLLGPNATTAGNGSRVAEAVLVPATSDPNPYNAGAVSVISVNASNVTIAGLTIDGHNAALTSGVTYGGVDIDAAEGISSYSDVSNITVQNNIVRDMTYTGVDFEQGTGPASSNNIISTNLIQNLGGGGFGYGIGVLIYDNFYAQITHNEIDQVRVGVQTGNFYAANPGGDGTATISDNTISAVRRGIYYNLHYSDASPFTVDGNTITGIDDPTAPATAVWYGILISSQQTAVGASPFDDNSIDGSAVVTIPTTAGYAVWNTPTTGSLTITGGSVTGSNYGVYVSNWVSTSNQNAPDSHVTVSGMSIGAKQYGVFVEDNPLNTTSPTSVSATITGDTDITTGGTGTGTFVSGANASATITGNDASIHGNATGVDVNGGSAAITGNHIYDNTTGISLENSGSAAITGNDFTGATPNVTDIYVASTAGLITGGTLSGNHFAGSAYYVNLNTSQNLRRHGSHLRSDEQFPNRRPNVPQSR